MKTGFVSSGVRHVRKGGGQKYKGNVVMGVPLDWIELHNLKPRDYVTMYMGLDGSLVIMPGEVHDITYADSHEELIKRHYASYRNDTKEDGNA